MISPELQGRVITSSLGGLKGYCNGWFDKQLLASKVRPINGIGGEDRIWIGPLGGQFSFYYQQIGPLSEENWSVPKTMNTEAFKLVRKAHDRVDLQKEMKLVNFIGTEIKLKVNRSIQILDRPDIQRNLSLDFGNDIAFVAFESAHSIVNLNSQALQKETGLVSIWECRNV